MFCETSLQNLMEFVFYCTHNKIRSAADRSLFTKLTRWNLAWLYKVSRMSTAAAAAVLFAHLATHATLDTTPQEKVVERQIW
jgi:hypothetical protein